MKLVSYNVENLFARARAMNEVDPRQGTRAIEGTVRLNQLFSRSTYTPRVKLEILRLLKSLGLDEADDGGDYAILRQNKGKLVKRPRNKPVEVVANGRSSWIGWVELKTEDVNEVATRATAHTIRDLRPDVLGVVEAESRPALVRFAEGVLAAGGAKPFEHIMLIDGNDQRGIDVGVMLAKGYDIVSMESHVDDEDREGRIFSRDCAAYTIRTPKRNSMVIIMNHLKSKISGGDAIRLRQAKRVKSIYEKLRHDGHELVAVMGDMNDTPDSAPLAPLIKETDLKDIAEHPHFDNGGRRGTYGNGAAGEKIDYILLSPKLFAKVTKGGIFRMGVWGGKNGTLFPHYPEITRAEEAASDHAAIWAEVGV
jgi:endonuclease/exonuclease/phosphatase family metal-dependent hydrolase